jgi:hypothetical protein
LVAPVQRPEIPAHFNSGYAALDPATRRGKGVADVCG